MNDNRQAFLDNIAQSLGRPLRTKPISRPVFTDNYPKTRLTNLTQEALCQALIDYVTTQTVTCKRTTPENVANELISLCEQFGGGNIVTSRDPRFDEFNLIDALNARYNVHVWDPAQGEQNIEIAKHANIGIVFADAALAESGGVVLYSSANVARSISLLPETSIFIFRKSQILPRVAQLAEQLHQKAQRGERMPYCINIIGGASSTADIELIKVFGVHGPMNAAYLIIDDC